MAPIPKGRGWDDKKSDRAVLLYKKFLDKVLTEGFKYPRRMVETVWHMHIVDTEMYADDCQKLFGKMLHCAPYQEFETKKKVFTLSAEEQEEVQRIAYDAWSAHHQKVMAAMAGCPFPVRVIGY